ncbi:hypothetical protein BGZ83_006055 [Gryganskiella cystojenkinii]|nr:hypothetical protein BGZ83_006055 [Gryganskiella cystojenkinii]
MILAGSETGTIKGGMTGTGGLKGGTLSPAWSMTSIPRDISATYYDNDSSDTRTENLAHPMDEKLYGLVDRYGFLVEEGRTPTAEKNGAASSSLSSSQRSVRTTHDMRRQAKVVEKEQERSLKWARMAKRQPGQIEVQYAFPESSKFIKRIYKGIPDCWRAAAWSYLITRRSTNFEPNIRRIYHDMLEISSPEEEQIDLDIPRTMHGHIMFRTRFGPGQCSLFKVLKAYSNYNHRVGYCQGMASVVAMMLTFFDEEKTFVLLSQLFDRYSINDLVIPGFPSLFEAFYIQEELTKMYAPKVFQALKTMGIATPSYASRWYITLYSAGVVPYRTLLRIWDIFLLEGFDWLYFMALALLQYHETSLIQNNFERTMEMLNAKMDIQDDERLLKLAHDLLKKARRTNIVERLKSSYAATQKQPENSVMSDSPSPLDQAELVTLIGKHITILDRHPHVQNAYLFRPHDLLACCTVSKFWRKTLIPVLWRCYDEDAMAKVSRAVLEQNSHFFVYYQGRQDPDRNLPDLKRVPCSNLKELTLWMPHTTASPFALISSNPGLRKLILHGNWRTEPGGLSGLDLSHCSNLSDLSLNMFKLLPGDFSRVLGSEEGVTSRLTRLTLTNIQGEYDFASWVPLSNLTHLHLGLMRKDLTPGLEELVRLCPKVENLVISFDTFYNLRPLTTILQENQIRLKSLQFLSTLLDNESDREMEGMDNEDEEEEEEEEEGEETAAGSRGDYGAQDLIRNCGALTELEISVNHLTDGVQTAIRHHRSTLEVLRLIIEASEEEIDDYDSDAYEKSRAAASAHQRRFLIELFTEFPALKQLSFWDDKYNMDEQDLFETLISRHWTCEALHSVSIRGCQFSSHAEGEIPVQGRRSQWGWAPSLPSLSSGFRLSKGPQASSLDNLFEHVDGLSNLTEIRFETTQYVKKPTRL